MLISAFSPEGLNSSERFQQKTNFLTTSSIPHAFHDEASCSTPIIHHMANPEQDHRFVYNEQGHVDILNSPFFDVNPEVDQTVKEYIERITFTLAAAIKDQLSSVQWQIDSNTGFRDNQTQTSFEKDKVIRRDRLLCMFYENGGAALCVLLPPLLKFDFTVEVSTSDGLAAPNEDKLRSWTDMQQRKGSLDAIVFAQPQPSAVAMGALVQVVLVPISVKPNNEIAGRTCMADPEVDYGFLFDDQGMTDILRSPFFDMYFSFDKTANDYIDRILYQLSLAIEEHIRPGHWVIINRHPPPPTPATFPTTTIVGLLLLVKVGAYIPTTRVGGTARKARAYRLSCLPLYNPVKFITDSTLGGLQILLGYEKKEKTIDLKPPKSSTVKKKPHDSPSPQDLVQSASAHVHGRRSRTTPPLVDHMRKRVPASASCLGRTTRTQAESRSLLFCSVWDRCTSKAEGFRLRLSAWDGRTHAAIPLSHARSLYVWDRRQSTGERSALPFSRSLSFSRSISLFLGPTPARRTGRKNPQKNGRAHPLGDREDSSLPPKSSNRLLLLAQNEEIERDFK
ncbi:hypothetical protein M5K25_014118 [Dendrobium thyrsiflorum]|uniref:Uncharacterized protein n=1 Tax=Dendrobium thyrsiflorum TaxID=117978 RepID=A0ABD0UV85_DENTH